MKHLFLPAALLAVQFAHAQTTFRGDNAHTGLYKSASVRHQPQVKWRFSVGCPIAGSPAVSNDAIFIGSSAGTLFAIDRATGDEKWRFNAKGSIDSSPALANGVIYFGCMDGSVYALDADSGKQKWQFQMEYERKYQAPHLHGQNPPEQMIPDAWDFFTSSPAVDGDTLFIGSGDGHVYAVAVADGSLKWKFQTGDVVHASPALAHSLVYVGSWNSRFYALDRDTGKPVWTFQAGVDQEIHNKVGFQASACVVGSSVFVGCRDGKAYALSALSGKQLWSHDWGMLWVSDSPASDGRTVYVGTNPVAALDAKTGDLQYTLPGPTGVFSFPAITDDSLYFGALSGSLFAYDRASGKQLWEFKTDGLKSDPLKLLGKDGSVNPQAFPLIYGDFEDDYITMYKRFSLGSVLSSPVVSNGEIYFGSTDGNLYALK